MRQTPDMEGLVWLLARDKLPGTSPFVDVPAVMSTYLGKIQGVTTLFIKMDTVFFIYKNEGDTRKIMNRAREAAT
jgi:hypothetical protein